MIIFHHTQRKTQPSVARFPSCQLYGLFGDDMEAANMMMSIPLEIPVVPKPGVPLR